MDKEQLDKFINLDRQETLDLGKDSQAKAWCLVWDLCKELGMNSYMARTGQDCVLNFIKDLHAKATK